MQREKEVAKILLDNNCLQLSPSEPFTYASGLKGPIYCDNRKLLSFVEARSRIVQHFVETINESGIKFDQLAGLATAGIPHCAFIANELSVPMIYIRGKAKGHGKQNQIEGSFKKGQSILLVEDLINQGKSLEDAIIAALAEGLVPVGVVSIVTYEMQKSKEILSKYKIPLISLTNFSDIVSLALEQNVISTDELNMLTSWQLDPANWVRK
ncbi:orotate phosphoribosyltransferase [Halobacteriovorax sp. HLS]|uniref:orotate phosphoribosyltransferase n=1 Tax=Halobacteriovorax sp. HLS TaxID=2234000 RepID=UPI0013E2AA96|nr:orotate phosphoribosyltransferase [Halobacteriovorax sp. HLS]